MEKEARRAQVLKHAKRIFARKGYYRTNVADIISRARIARGTFYLYFENKKDLFEELLEQVLRELAFRIQRIRLGPDEPEPAAQLRENLRRVVTFVLNERDLTNILMRPCLGALIPISTSGILRAFTTALRRKFSARLIWASTWGWCVNATPTPPPIASWAG